MLLVIKQVCLLCYMECGIGDERTLLNNWNNKLRVPKLGEAKYESYDRRPNKYVGCYVCNNQVLECKFSTINLLHAEMRQAVLEANREAHGAVVLL